MNQKLKETLDVLEDIMTIIVSLMAIWGTVVAIENGFFHKIKRIADHYHADIVKAEEKIPELKNL